MATEHFYEDIVDQPSDVVGDIITDAGLFNSLRLPGTYRLYDRQHAGPGTRIEGMQAIGGKVFSRYIVDWELHKLFSVGASHDEWIFRWYLRAADQKTHVRFEGKIEKESWLKQLIKGEDAEAKSVIKAPVIKLKEACHVCQKGNIMDYFLVLKKLLNDCPLGVLVRASGQWRFARWSQVR